MSEEENNISGEQQTEAAAPSVVEQGESQVGTEQQRMVPLEALESERAHRQSLQEELKVSRDHMSLMHAQQSRSNESPKDEFGGLTDDDVLTVGEFKKAIQRKEKEYQVSIEELRMSQKHTDYQEVVTNYLPEVLKNNPGLQRTLQSSQDYELAYYLAKNSDAYKSANKKAKRHETAERILDNAEKTRSLSSVGNTTPINQAKRYRDMSDKDFMKQVHKNLGYH